jgi:hypothetical protein
MDPSVSIGIRQMFDFEVWAACSVLGLRAAVQARHIQYHSVKCSADADVVCFVMFNSSPLHQRLNPPAMRE